ncbi:hypothetical protein B1748_10385 [Paenibacillus sp. MY03]|nr:hypothetical protein B1748_10385 [Paenibacillus sp. MY03]
MPCKYVLIMVQFGNKGVIDLKYGMYVVAIIMTIILIVGCSNKSPFGENLESKDEVFVKSEKIEKTITDENEISDLVNVLNKSKAIEPPEKAKGIKLDVSKETVLIKFPKADFFYIGDGYLYYGNNGQYYSVSTDIEDYITE